MSTRERQGRPVKRRTGKRTAKARRRSTARSRPKRPPHAEPAASAAAATGSGAHRPVSGARNGAGNGSRRGATAKALLGRVGPQALASLLGVSVEEVWRLVRAGIIPRADRAQYDLCEAVQGYLAHLKRVAEGRDSTDRGHRLRRLKAQADLAELAAAERHLNAIPREQIERVTAQLVAGWGAAMLTAGTLAARAHAAGTIEERRFILDEWAHEQLELLAGRPVEYADAAGEAQTPRALASTPKGVKP